MFRAVTLAAVDEIALPQADVFFADRLSEGIIALAERFRARGAVIVFEPSAVGDEASFQRMLKLTHVLKYADERLPHLHITPPEDFFLEIQTLGSGGLRFRMNADRDGRSQWVSVEPFTLKRIRDTAGAGDWCTAGLIHVLASKGLTGLDSASIGKIGQALIFAQALSAWNCEFEGARGGMYLAATDDFRRSIEEIVASKSRAIANPHRETSHPAKVAANVSSSRRRRLSVLNRLLRKS